jgi:hypothetical protein
LLPGRDLKIGDGILAHEVFISYATRDALVAGAICAALEAKGAQCWIAPRDIVSGTKYSQSIVNGITGSRLMVVVYSAAANESNHVVAEIDRAYNKRIPILPVRIENVPLSQDLEYYLSTSQWFDALDGRLASHLGQTVEGIEVPDRSKVTVTVEDASSPSTLSLMSVIKLTYTDQGKTVSVVRRDMTMFSKQNDRLVPIVNRWSAEN